MAKYNNAISVTFNDNDGGVSWSCDLEQAYDVHRHQRIFGIWRTRWILFKRFWKGLRYLERHGQNRYGPVKTIWVLKPAIPE